jgi:uncharacterized delta-60 repeat protein
MVNFALARYRDDGSLDTSFHGDGKVLTDFPELGSEGIAAIAIDDSDRIVAGGTSGRKFAVARYTVDGNLDTSFRGDGTVVTDFRSTEEENIEALCIDHRNRIIVAGWADGRMALARYHEDGALDSSFHGDGKVLTNFRSTAEESAHAVALDRWGRIVVGGTADDMFALARYTENGRLDPSFHGDGKVLTDFRSTQREGIRALAIDRHGRIVVAGKAVRYVGEVDAKFALARYTEDGNLDPSFHRDGKVLTNFWSDQEESITGVNGLAIDGADRIVVGGTTRHRFALARYTDDGNLDTSFHGDGKVVTNFRSTFYERITGLALDHLGRIVVAGLAHEKFALARYIEDGTLDTSFHGDGKVITDFRSTRYEGAHDIAIDHQGRIVVAGYAWRYD